MYIKNTDIFIVYGVNMCGFVFLRLKEHLDDYSIETTNLRHFECILICYITLLCKKYCVVFLEIIIVVLHHYFGEIGGMCVDSQKRDYRNNVVLLFFYVIF